jgi:hypothetical protein
VNEGEVVDQNFASLVLFMTVDIEQKHINIDFPSPKPLRFRSSSFDLEKVRAEFKKREARCIIS